MTAIHPGTASVGTDLANNIGKIATFLQYARIAFTTFKIVKKAVRFLNSLRK